jgi:hypothetical protein
MKKNSPKNKDNKPRKVGFKCPPEHSRWKPGQSGNPSGLKKKLNLLNMEKVIMDVFLKKVVVRDGKKARRVPKVAALLEKWLNAAFQAARALNAIFRFAERYGALQYIEDVPAIDLSRLTPEEQAIVSEAGQLAIKAMSRSPKDGE